ncbi:MAG: ATP-binding protein [Candidatus Thermoplasmatota archaeon]|nr:ATP-binding protein [Candidatus Thermoplasmatota archaeon]
MVDIETLRTYMSDKREDMERIDVRQRRIHLEGSLDFITSIYGPRRSGKSFLFYSMLMNNNNILYLNFDDIQLDGWTPQDIVRSVTIYQEIYRKEPEMVLLDEVQRVNGWEKAVITLYERKRYRIMITGSSSKMLAREIATTLRGRTINHLVLPLSFKEYLDFIGVTYEDPSSTRQKAELRSHLEDYLYNGSFPGILTYPGPLSKFYEEYMDLVLYRDLVERHGISNTGILRFIQKAVIGSRSKEFSINRLFNTWRSMRFEASKKTFYEYFGHLEEAMFALPLYRYHPSDRSSDLSTPKVYLPDPAMGSTIGGKQIGRSMENAVFLHLLREQSFYGGIRLFYWKDHDREVDFVIVKGDRITDLVQVSYALDDNSIAREIKGFKSFARSIDDDCRRTLITWTGEESVPEGIDIIPLWRYLLQ